MTRSHGLLGRCSCVCSLLVACSRVACCVLLVVCCFFFVVALRCLLFVCMLVTVRCALCCLLCVLFFGGRLLFVVCCALRVVWRQVLCVVSYCVALLFMDRTNLTHNLTLVLLVLFFVWFAKAVVDCG